MELAFPVLIGDIGGTNARFAVIPKQKAPAVHLPGLATADYATFEDALAAALDDYRAEPPVSAILAIAGPIDGEEIELTNCPWIVRPNAMIRDFGMRRILILNDFEAQALAATALGPADLVAIGGGSPVEDAPRAVLGPGTGIGVAGLVRSGGRWVPIPGEGGHVDIGPRTKREYAIFPHLETADGRVSAEQILCGSGLVNLHRAIATADGADVVMTDPAAISAAALAGDDTVAVEALSIFVDCLGRLAGDVALLLMARGGVFITGGIAQKILPALTDGRLRAAFEDKAPHGALMRTVPVSVMVHPAAALAGLAAFASAPQEFAVATTGRFWQA